MASKSIMKKEDSASSKKNLGVQFGDLVIYEFPNILGDNPGVSEGVPLSIGWKHNSKNVVGVDYYEFLRQNRPRRRRKELVIPSAARDTFLLGMGYKLDQLVKAAEETKKIRKSRQASMKGTTWEKFRSVFDKKKPTQPTEPKIVVARTG